MLMNALWRLNLPDKTLNVIRSFYKNPQFRIKDNEGKSTYRRQNTGIRQGCPLSPYLFVLLMTVLIHDVHEDVRTQHGHTPHTHSKRPTDRFTIRR